MSEGYGNHPAEDHRPDPADPPAAADTWDDAVEAAAVWPMGQLCPRVLVVSGSRVERDSVTARLSARGMEVEPVSNPADALAAVATDRFDLAIVQSSMGGGRGLELVRGLVELDESLGILMLSRGADLDDAVAAMRLGVLDFLVGRMDAAKMVARVEEAVERARRHRHERQRAERLKRVCRDLDTAQNGADPISGEPNDLAIAYRELSEQLAHVGLTTEFNSLVRQELDLESLLRTVLEFLLAKLGAVNAAIFLPSTTGDYSLGAYVNYDCPKDTAEVLLEHLAAVVPERFEHEGGVVLMRSERSLLDRLGDQADWLDGHAVACMSCRQDDECLAVVTLFRDRRTGFSDEHASMLEALSALFAQQLSRVIHIHHRHLPKNQWGLDAQDDEGWDEGADDYGMAA